MSFYPGNPAVKSCHGGIFLLGVTYGLYPFSDPAGTPDNQKPRNRKLRGLANILAATYFPGRLPFEYRRHIRVSLPCSGWERVVHRRYGHQKSVGISRVNGKSPEIG